MQTIKFEKWHGIGNDFVMVNGFEEQLSEAALPSLSEAMCDRRFGVGSDGLILALPGQDASLQMRMFNPDGSESEMCGNGVRCFALFAQEQGLATDAVIPVETGAGLLTLHTEGGHRVRVDMGPARLTRGEIGMTGPGDGQFIDQPFGDYRGTAVSMGNPHVVIFVDDASQVDLERVGPVLERNDLFPKRVNVHFVQVVDRTHLIQRTWERGAGITLACGTGACACGVAAFLNGLSERAVSIQLPGGVLEIEYTPEGRVWMTGPAEKVFDGIWER